MQTASHLLLAEAAKRASHMAAALTWYESALSQTVTFQNVFQILVESLSQVGMNRLEQTNQQVLFIAVGKSGIVAQLAVSMLASVGINARFLHPTEAFHGDFGAVCEGDTAVFISNNGRSAELLQVIPKLKERACTLFALTARTDSPLAQACHHTLPLPPFEEQCPLNQAPITSTVTTLALCQMLVAATMEVRAFDLEQYARNHPGGAIGKRIFVRVDDLMTSGEHLPTVTQADNFKTCVSVMGRFAMSAILVIEGPQKNLAGLISEKDLRLAMESWGPAVFEHTAADFMNPSPIVAHSGLLAVDALRLMENRPRPLSVLPIVTQANTILGLLRIHDLVKEGISLS